MLKKIVIITGIILLAFIGGLLALPFFFKDKVFQAILKESPKYIKAKLDIQSMDLTLLKTFPYLGIELENVQLTGIDTFDKIPLFTAKQALISCNLKDILFGESPVRIRKVRLDQPLINLIILENGQANYLISRNTDASGGSPFKANLHSYEINQGTLRFDNKLNGVFTEALNLNHQGQGNMEDLNFDLSTTTQSSDFSLSYKGLPILAHVQANWVADINIQVPKNLYTFKENQLTLNELPLKFNGWMKNDPEVISMDLKIDCPQNSTKSIFSILPGAYTKDFAKVESSGSFKLSGLIKGTYKDNTLPSFYCKMNIQDGAMKYPSLPLGITKLQSDIQVFNPGGVMDATQVIIQPISFKLGSDFLQGKLSLKTPVSNPDVDAELKSDLHLENFAKVFPLPSVDQLQGHLVSQIAMKGTMDDLEAKQYANVQMSGNLTGNDILIQQKNQPSIQIKNVNCQFSPEAVSIPQFSMLFGKSDISGSVSFNNILQWFSANKTLTGTLNMKSNVLDMNEWTSNSKEKESTTIQPGKTVDFDKYDLTTTAEIQSLKLPSMDLQNVNVQGSWKSSELQVKNLAFQHKSSDVQLSGSLRNLMNYLSQDGTLQGNIQLNSNNLNLNEWMPSNQNVAASSKSPVIIPENIAVLVQGNIKNLTYDDMKLAQVTGNIVVNEGKAKLEDTKAKAFGGMLLLEGVYDSKGKKEPGFDMSYEMRDVQFRDLFTQFNTIRMLAPIGMYIDGRLNSRFNLNGTLGQDLLPNWNSLNASGLIHTLKGIVGNSPPLENLSQQFNWEGLKGLTLTDTKNWFDIRNGQLELKPMDYNYKTVGMTFNGTHSISNEMNYSLLAKVPRKLVEKSLGTKALSGSLQMVNDKLKKLGVQGVSAETINLLFSITGSFKNPKVKMQFAGVGNSTTPGDMAKEIVTQATDKAKDSLEKVAQKEVNKAKEQAGKIADQIADSLSKVADAKAKELADKAKQAVGDSLGKMIEKQAGQAVGDKAKEELDKAKEKLKQWDPFKKKK